MFYSGCPMWGYKDWVGAGKLFPPRTPASDFLRLYSRKMSTVEGNTVFYALPSAETVKRWAQETPKSFRFCPKVSRNISHEGILSAKKAETALFVERMRGLGERLGPIFLQLPPTFTPAQMPQLEAFLDFWPQGAQLAVEVRHPDFYEEVQEARLNELLARQHIGRVMMDTRPMLRGTAEEQRENQARERKPHLPLRIVTTSDFAFVRYIGHPRMEENEAFLETWAQQIGEWLKQGLTVYAFCHCPYEEHSPGICAELYRRVAVVASLPPLTWTTTETSTAPEQFRLF
jgi:uncharacterized protein YecE (DUF72 family)